ncbi:unnamed protein product [Caenorhabditis bovis]|uniref:CX domain-containing protein n=1 Tax=Caenorhabditis bovis TaxID=2654633 RepID=A0A8S1EK16_9PELO|nr:unnamed protein product [Caenorhabditis bovis]
MKVVILIIMCFVGLHMGQTLLIPYRYCHQCLDLDFENYAYFFYRPVPPIRKFSENATVPFCHMSPPKVVKCYHACIIMIRTVRNTYSQYKDCATGIDLSMVDRKRNLTNFLGNASYNKTLGDQKLEVTFLTASVRIKNYNSPWYEVILLTSALGILGFLLMIIYCKNDIMNILSCQREQQNVSAAAATFNRSEGVRFMSTRRSLPDEDLQ